MHMRTSFETAQWKVLLFCVQTIMKESRNLN